MIINNNIIINIIIIISKDRKDNFHSMEWW